MTQTLTTKVLNDFIAGQGYGVAPSAVEAMARELLANREAQPVAYLKKSIIDSDRFDSADPEIILHPNTPDGWHSDYKAVFTAPPAPAVPPEKQHPDVEEYGGDRYYGPYITECDQVDGWNACRAAMLAQPVSQGYKLVPVEPTEEMIAAAMNCDDVEFNSDETFCVNFDNIYRAMLAAAPEVSNDA